MQESYPGAAERTAGQTRRSSADRTRPFGSSSNNKQRFTTEIDHPMNAHLSVICVIFGNSYIEWWHFRLSQRLLLSLFPSPELAGELR